MVSKVCNPSRVALTQSEFLKGPAQTFFLSSEHGYFRVELPCSKPNPLDPTTLFCKQFASDPYADTPIQATAYPWEMKIFLQIDNWLVEVEWDDRAPGKRSKECLT